MKRTWLLVAVLSLVLGLTMQAEAGLLLYEPFDYTPGEGNLDGAGGSELGFDGASTWSASTLGENADVLKGTLAFGRLAVSGGSAHWDTSLNSADKHYLTRGIDFSVTSGDLWSSYLITAFSDSATEIISYGAGIFDGSNFEFVSFRKNGAGSDGSRIYYGDSQSSNFTTEAPHSQLWLVVTKHEDLGTAAGSGVARIWILTESIFESIQSGGVTEAELDDNADYKSTVTNGDTTPTIADTQTFGIMEFDNNATADSIAHFDFDELRIGTTIADVLPLTRALEPVTLQDPSFENLGPADANVMDETHYRFWGANNNNIGTFNLSGTGSNADRWLVRADAAGDNIDYGDLRNEVIEGKSGSQFFIYQTTADRGVFQFFETDSMYDQARFILDVDVLADTANSGSYALKVVGFDDPSEVSVDVGGASSITHSGSGGFELIDMSLRPLYATVGFEFRRFAGQFSAKYNYVGIMLACDFPAITPPLIAFDNVRFYLEPALVGTLISIQ